MKVLLIQSLGHLYEPSGFLRTCFLEPLGLEYLASALRDKGHIVKIEYGNINEKYFKKILTYFVPDIIGYSVYSYTFNQSLKLARIAKDLLNNVKNIFGGYHPTAVPEIIMESVVDYVVIGEGEKTLCELIENIEQGKSPKHIRGIAFKKNRKIYKTTYRPRINCIDEISRPLREKRFLLETKQYQIAFPPPSKQIAVAQVIYSRGCPFNCHFCSSKSMWGSKVYWRDPISVVDEIENLYETYETNLIYFPDLTFNVNINKVKELCSELIKRNLPVYWWALFRVDNIDKELLYILKDAKCVKLSFGIESTDDYTIYKVKGNPNYNWNEVKNIFRYANNIGLIVKAFLMVGFPWEKRENIISHKQELINSDIDELRITFATPFPATKYYKYCLKNNLFSSLNIEDFTTEIPVVKNRYLSNNELIELKNNIFRDFYTSLYYKKRILKKLQKFPYLINSYVEYFNFLIDKNIFDSSQIDTIRTFIKEMIKQNQCLNQNELSLSDNTILSRRNY